MPLLLDDPVDRLLTLLQAGSERRLIGLAGLPGSGKTTLATRLAAEVNRRAHPDTMLALSMDGFHLTRARLQQLPNPEEAFARRGAPWTFDPVALAARLRAVRTAAGREVVSWPDFKHEIGDPVENAHIIPPSTSLVLIEGLYLLYDGDGWDAVGACCDERWYLDTPLDVAMERLIARHMAAWNWTREAAEQRVASNDRLNAEIVLRSRDHADFLLTG
jgi:pantothenate kinase